MLCALLWETLPWILYSTLMLNFLTTTLLILGALTITSCGGNNAGNDGSGPLLPIPGGPQDLSNVFVKQAVDKFLQSTGAPVASSYEITRVDLNDDKRRDAVVLFKTPYGYWCGMHGCSMLIFKANDDKFTLLSSVQPVRDPIFVSRDKTNGWRDLVVRVSGRWSESKDVALRFDGRTYPANPSSLPPYLRFDPYSNTRLFR